MKTFRAVALALALASAALPPRASFDPFGASPLAQGRLEQLRGMAELKSWFNGNKGRPRLILLLSPT
jgi:hypothetical protein